MKILVGEPGTGKTHYFGEGVIFDAGNDKELSEYLEAARVLPKVLINVWYKPDIKLFGNSRAFVELHEDVDLKEHISSVKIFEIPSKDEMEKALGITLPDTIKNWWDAVHYVKYGVEPIEKKQHIQKNITLGN